MDLDRLRKRIDTLDEKIVKLLNQRAKAALDVGKVKDRSKSDVYVPARERDVLQRVTDINNGPLEDKALMAIYREIMSSSLSLEKGVNVSYLGPPATFSHQAARSRFGNSVDYVPCETIKDVFDAVQKGGCDYGVVPVENSTEGAITHTLDEFFETPLEIYAEIYLKVSHNLMVRSARTRIKRIYSNPSVFGQCRAWLSRNMPGVELIPANSTGRAAEIAAGESGSAAIAGMLAAELNKLHVFAREIQDSSGNTTRFLVMGRKSGKATGADKTSIVFSVKHKPGALYGALGSFHRAGLNMTKIESRPSRIKEWEYLFFVDVEGHFTNAGIKKALKDLENHCSHMKVLGSYPRAPEAS